MAVLAALVVGAIKGKICYFMVLKKDRGVKNELEEIQLNHQTRIILFIRGKKTNEVFYHHDNMGGGEQKESEAYLRQMRAWR